ncbi:hypothetical protein VTN00DRAFT_5150 [Thermoascus crustaceus]|uniref:uncharacterized protein n=1 Tax=Thermoascus crustaceus TaxID=5088 RepID=UPI00374471AB
MNHNNPLYDSDDWPLRNPQREGSISTATQDSGSSIISLTQYAPPLSPPLSSPSSIRKYSLYSVPEETERIELAAAVTVSLVRKDRLFKIRYTYIDVCKENDGSLRFLELGGGGQQSGFIHTFTPPRVPLPHLEHPKLSGDTSFRISFLEEQAVQTTQTAFSTQLSYTFEEWGDCVQFQELLLASKLVFIGGVAEAKSKGRGEECISQNLRVFRDRHNKHFILFFANSQRREKKRYISIPVNCIEHVDPGKKVGRPVSLQFLPNFDTITQMKMLQIRFLDENDRKRFCDLLKELNG